MAELDEQGDEPNFDLFWSFGLDFFREDELLLTETDLTEKTEQTEIGQLNDEELKSIELAFVLFTSFAQTESGCFGYSYQKIEAKITIFFCSRIINLSFNGLTYIIPANNLFIVNLIFTDGIKVFLNTLTKKIEANCKITIFFGVE